MPDKTFAFETLALHGGQQPDPTTTSRGVPVYRTSSFVFPSTERAANLFALKELGNIYSRIMIPTQDVLEQRAGGLSPDLVRLSIGLERVDDIIGDIEQALK